MTGAHLLVAALIVLLAGAPLVLVAGRVDPTLAKVVAGATSAGAAVLGLVAAVTGAGDLRLPLVAVEADLVDLPLRVIGGGAPGAIGLLVLAVVAAIQVFASWYLGDDDRYAAFAATVSLFAAAMLLVVISRDLVLTLIGWEVMGWCSYLLIGHWSRKESARRAAYKAFMVTRLADVGFVLGVVALTALAGTSDLDKVNALVAGNSCAGGLCAVSQRGVDIALTALVIGVLGKSAQIPFQDWLTDAMEGPTPASALIHAATMVAAGSWVLAQLAPALMHSAVAGWVLAVSAGLTMVFAGFTAFFQTDLKRLLAWSTISQIGVMLSPLAVGRDAVAAADAATGHLYGHAIFKALLFLTVGWLSVIGGGTAARALRGRGHQVPVARAAWAIGLAALAGVPFTVGGFSKEGVIHAASAGQAGARGFLVTLALLVTVALTAAYATRAYLVVGHDRAPWPDLLPTPAAVRGGGEELPADAGADAAGPGAGATTTLVGAAGHSPRPAPVLVTGVIVALAVAALMGGLAFVTGALAVEPISWPLLALSVALITIGALVGWTWRPDDRLEPNAWMRRADAGFGADAAYVGVVATPVVATARLAAFVDREVIDFYVRAAGLVATAVAGMGLRVHARERVATNLVWILVGLLAVAGVALWR